MPRRKRTSAGTDGLLLVDKPAGVSSHDVVAAARRVTGESRIGHGGTLDPFATGLLVLLLGRATRLLQYLNDTPKVYEAQVRFGAETDTEDLLGAVVAEAPRPSREVLERARPSFVGTIIQVPPAYSAKRVDGQRAYALARAGHEVELAPRVMVIDRREVAWSPGLTLTLKPEQKPPPEPPPSRPCPPIRAWPYPPAPAQSRRPPSL